jgi:hypothetical protein
MAFIMDTYEQATGHTRGTQDVVIERGDKGTPDYLRRVYALPEPYTAGEYNEVLRDFEARYGAGERTE